MEETDTAGEGEEVLEQGESEVRRWSEYWSVMERGRDSREEEEVEAEEEELARGEDEVTEGRERLFEDQRD